MNEIPIITLSREQIENMYENGTDGIGTSKITTFKECEAVNEEEVKAWQNISRQSGKQNLVYDELVAKVLAGPDRWNRSSVERIAKRILGPTARTWKEGGHVVLGTQAGSVRMALGRGKDYEAAFKAVFVDTIQMRENYRKLEKGQEVDTNA